jgi:hypothetical protein
VLLTAVSQESRRLVAVHRSRREGIASNQLPLHRVMTMTANTVDRAYSWIKAQQHKDEIEAALGTFAAVEIL